MSVMEILQCDKCMCDLEEGQSGLCDDCILQQSEYTIHELTGHARERAMNKLREWNTQDIDFDGEMEYWTNELEAIGCSRVEIHYRVAHCQGDGASIDCRVDLQKFAEANPGFFDSWLALKAAIEDGQVDARVNGSKYSSPYTSSVDLNDSGQDFIPCGVFDGLDDDSFTELVQADIADCEADLLSFFTSKAHEIYESLSAEVLYRYGEESCIEMADANDYKFDEDGNTI